MYYLRFLSALLIAFYLTIPGQQLAAQTNLSVSQPLQQRANDVLRLFKAEPIENQVFDENFRNAVPPPQFRALTKQVVAQQGEPLEIVEIQPRNSSSATLKLRFEKSIATINIDLERAEPYRISGLLLTGFEAAGETIEQVVAAIDALPGRQGVLVQALSANTPPIAAIDQNGRYAIASTFKLYILAELDRAIRAKERSWSDVVKLGPKSHPSGISQNWPANSPVSLHTLAILMISISDNSATDTLIRIIGQKRLAEIVRTTGHSNPGQLDPFLMTRQASTLKMPVHSKRRKEYLTADRSSRRALLKQYDSILTLDTLDSRVLTNKPNYIDQLEWFASPANIVRLLDYLRINASAETRKILAINPGIGQQVAQKWKYFGYKGGSEPGVLSYNFLLKSRSGQDYAVSIHWNNNEQSLDEGKLLGLTTRLINLLVEN
ncbi:Beta-lactamase class A-like and penicillin binding proteins (PBPs) superfamily [hydrothermal vent metagenome]|uniref:Beta-lactamase class A-like and penicillin binding proteins (PBPs) superfamily n=1 Tax=hydrothermal vent metagenome TaxID=652676 RepID=A0A3B0SKH7_9ZZZZ